MAMIPVILPALEVVHLNFSQILRKENAHSAILYALNVLKMVFTLVKMGRKQTVKVMG
jgi:hypothetical protein